jgi:hypothetical protein
MVASSSNTETIALMFSDQVLVVSTQPLLCIPLPELISEATIDLIGQKRLKPRRTSLPTLLVTSSKSFPKLRYSFSYLILPF